MRVDGNKCQPDVGGEVENFFVQGRSRSFVGNLPLVIPYCQSGDLPPRGSQGMAGECEVGGQEGSLGCGGLFQGVVSGLIDLLSRIISIVGELQKRAPAITDSDDTGAGESSASGGTQPVPTPSESGGSGAGPSTAANGAKPGLSAAERPRTPYRHDVSNEFLYKPEADKDGKAVILIPAKYQGQVEKVLIKTAGGKSLHAGTYAGVGNGGREHYRFPRSGKQYSKELVVEIRLKSGKIVTVSIEDSSKRKVV